MTDRTPRPGYLWPMIACVVGLTAMTTTCGSARKIDAAAVSAQMDKYLNTQVKARKFMGSVLVARKGSVILKKGYGMANLELDVPNTPETKFRLGSITKQFVAAAILQLEQNGRLSVQDPICKYIPECPDAWGKITFHHLLSHTSGIPSFTGFPDYSKTWMLPSRPGQTILRFKDKPLDFAPGTKWSYSNSGYILLGHLLERISGLSYENYMRKHVFGPAGMIASGHDTHEAIIKNRADGYSRDSAERWINSAYHDMSIPIGGGDLYSTVVDLYKWDQALMTDKILNKESREKMFTPVMNNYAYGWGVGKQYGRLRHSHGGGINGFSTWLGRFPEQRAVVVVLCNMDFVNSGEIAANLVRILFGEKEVQPEDRKTIAIDDAKLADYIGVYEMWADARVVVSVERGKLMVMPPGAAREEVFAEAPDRFFDKSANRTLVFLRDPDGKVASLAIHNQDGTEIEAEKTSSEVPPLPKALSTTPEERAEYAGVYAHSPWFSVTISTEDGKLFGQTSGQQRYELFKEDTDKYFLKDVDARIEFQRGLDGKVNRLTLHQSGKHMFDRR